MYRLYVAPTVHNFLKTSQLTIRSIIFYLRSFFLTLFSCGYITGGLNNISNGGVTLVVHTADILCIRWDKPAG